MRGPCFLLLPLSIALAACNDAPPGWQKLLAGKIAEHHPAYTVVPVEGGNLVVQRPGKPDVPVDVNAIAQFCQRGPRDCGYATDQMLLQLRD
jgi:hypothetical protein